MTQVVSNVRVGRAARWGLRAALYAAVLTPLGLVALPAGDLVAERGRLERAASERRAVRRETLQPSEVDALQTELARLDARAQSLGSLASEAAGSTSALETRTLVALAAREQGLAIEELALGEDVLTLVARGRLSAWAATVDRLAALHLAPEVRSARFERENAETFRGRVELRAGAASAPTRSKKEPR